MAVLAARREDGVPSESVQSTEAVDEEDGDEGDVVTELWLSSSKPSAAIATGTNSALLVCSGKKSEKVVEEAAAMVLEAVAAVLWWWRCWWWLLLQWRSMVRSEATVLGFKAWRRRRGEEIRNWDTGTGGGRQSASAGAQAAQLGEPTAGWAS